VNTDIRGSFTPDAAPRDAPCCRNASCVNVPYYKRTLILQCKQLMGRGYEVERLTPLAVALQGDQASQTANSRQRCNCKQNVEIVKCDVEGLIVVYVF